MLYLKLIVHGNYINYYLVQYNHDSFIYTTHKLFEYFLWDIKKLSETSLQKYYNIN